MKRTSAEKRGIPREKRGAAPEKRGSAILSWVTTFVVLVLLCLAIVLVVVPRILGGTSLTVLTGSMEPGIMPGDVVVTKGVDPQVIDSLQVGDIIVFLPYADDPTIVTHRIVGISASASGRAFITQGDNNNVVDEWNPVRAEQIRGELVYVVPKVGYFKQWFGSHTNWVLYGVAAVVLLYAVVTFVSSFRKPKTVAGTHGDGGPIGNSSADEVPRRAVLD
ncbi:MAG: signal peptidase I [Propionibacteriaceae bacterium]|nr:signal peptidase I [Propionibacteriaceae bacterium]